MSETTKVLAEYAREKSDYEITGTIRDVKGALVVVPLTTMTLTLYAMDAALTIINSIDDVNINNVGRGTVPGDGTFAILLGPADNPVLDGTLLEETHRALVEWTYNGGASQGRQRIEFRVANFERVV